MFKIFFAALLSCAFVAPAFADCCDCAPACAPTRKRLKLVKVEKEVCVATRQCVTDECGCTKRQRVMETKTVCRKKLVRVEEPVDPCGCTGPLRRLAARLKARNCNDGCGCEAPADDCGCEAPVSDCGCDAAPAEPDCGCSGSAPAMSYDYGDAGMSYPTDQCFTDGNVGTNGDVDASRWLNGHRRCNRSSA